MVTAACIDAFQHPFGLVFDAEGGNRTLQQLLNFPAPGQPLDLQQVAPAVELLGKTRELQAAVAGCGITDAIGPLAVEQALCFATEQIQQQRGLAGCHHRWGRCSWTQRHCRRRSSGSVLRIPHLGEDPD